jgi:hypothetical protein
MLYKTHYNYCPFRTRDRTTQTHTRLWSAVNKKWVNLLALGNHPETVTSISHIYNLSQLRERRLNAKRLIFSLHQNTTCTSISCILIRLDVRPNETSLSWPPYTTNKEQGADRKHKCLLMMTKTFAKSRTIFVGKHRRVGACSSRQVAKMRLLRAASPQSFSLRTGKQILGTPNDIW